MRTLVLFAVTIVPALALAAPQVAPTTTLGDVAAHKEGAWSAEDAPAAGDRAPQDPRRGARVGVAPASLPQAPESLTAASPESPESAASPAEAQAAEAKLAASEAFAEVVRAKLAAADAVATRAAAPDVHRIALTDYQLLLQRATCAAVHGELERGEGAECMARPLATTDADFDDNEEAQLCAAQGGVLVGRMESCTQASIALANLHVDEGASVGLEALVGAFADVARKCWGRTLCVE